MPNANKIKGTRFESAIRDAAKSFGLDAHRAPLAGAADEGDVWVSLFCVQAKDVAAPAYNKWLSDVSEQKIHAGLPFGVVAHKTRNKPINESKVVMTFGEFLNIAKRLELAEGFVNSSPSTAYAYAQALDKR